MYSTYNVYPILLLKRNSIRLIATLQVFCGGVSLCHTYFVRRYNSASAWYPRGAVGRWQRLLLWRRQLLRYGCEGHIDSLPLGGAHRHHLLRRNLCPEMEEEARFAKWTVYVDA